MHRDREMTALVNSINLEPIVYALVEKADGPKWDLSRALSAEVRYRKFLYAVAVADGNTLVPSIDVDEFWHAHMLDSYKYFEDCELIFGHYLHHFPYLGSRGEADKELLNNLYRASVDLQEELFSESPDNEGSSVCGGSACGSGCGSTYVEKAFKGQNKLNRSAHYSSSNISQELRPHLTQTYQSQTI